MQYSLKVACDLCEEGQSHRGKALCNEVISSTLDPLDVDQKQSRIGPSAFLKIYI
uniref:Uncharacterized protein n=1 Tax=Arion vulgaris TaxID=1028688 RepID=A0A0B7BUS1_9EUPU